MNYGLLPQGFNLKRLADLRASIRSKLESRYGQLLDYKPDSVIGQLIDVFSYELYELWETSERVYHSLDILKAEGEALDRLATFFNIYRKGATRQRGYLTIGQSGFQYIPPGTIFESDNSSYKVQVIGSLGGWHATAGSRYDVVQNVLVEAVDDYPSIIKTDEIFKDYLPFSGPFDIISYTNSEPFFQRTEDESDADLRLRLKTGFNKKGNCTDLSIKSKILDLPFIEECVVISNRSHVVDSYNHPPHSLNVYIWPENLDEGQRARIYDTIAKNAPAGILASGKEFQATLIDPYGHMDIYPYGYYSPVKTVLEVQISISKNELFPVDGDDQIKRLYSEFVYKMKIGDPLRITNLYCLLNKIPGIENPVVKIKSNGAFLPQDYDTAKNEKLSLPTVKVYVTTNP